MSTFVGGTGGGIGGEGGIGGDGFLPATGFGPGSIIIALIGGALTLGGAVMRRFGRNPTRTLTPDGHRAEVTIP